MMSLISRMKVDGKQMAARFKCKKCKKRFDISDGRDAIQECIAACEKPTCPLRGKSLAYLPKKREIQTLDQEPEAANDEDVIEVYEEQPIGGLVSYREMKKKYGL